MYPLNFMHTLMLEHYKLSKLSAFVCVMWYGNTFPCHPPYKWYAKLIPVRWNWPYHWCTMKLTPTCSVLGTQKVVIFVNAQIPHFCYLTACATDFIKCKRWPGFKLLPTFLLPSTGRCGIGWNYVNILCIGMHTTVAIANDTFYAIWGWNWWIWHYIFHLHSISILVKAWYI